MDGRMFSPASLELDVAAGTVTNVFYRPHAWARRPGKMSLEPQEIYGRPTKLFVYGVGIPFLIITLILVILVPFAMFSDASP